MKVLILGPKARYDAYAPDFLSQLPVEPVFCPIDQSPLQAAAANPDTRALLVDAITPVDAQLMDLLPRLELIHSEGVAFNRIDLEAARARGIYVCNNKGCNAASVAEHTVMLMLMALRHGVTGHRAVREGRQIQMKEQVMVSDAPELGVTYLPLEELAARCDILSLHCAVNDKTRHLVDDALLAHIKRGAILVNTARGELVDDLAVRRALIDGRLGAIAVDTLFPEPTPADHPLVDLPPEVADRAVYSPHLGGITGGSFRRAHRNMWNSVRLVMEGHRPNFIVNGL